jgi:hypothetical protein
LTNNDVNFIQIFGVIKKYICIQKNLNVNQMVKHLYTELSYVVQERAEGPKAPSPGQRPGYNSNQQVALFYSN